MSLSKAVADYFAKFSSLSGQYFYGFNFIANHPELHLKIIDKMGLRDSYSDGLQILDVYATQPAWTNTLNATLNPEKHVLMDKNKRYLNIQREYLELLPEERRSKMQIFETDPYTWANYNHLIEELKVIEPYKNTDLTRLNPKFLVNANLANSQFGEGFLIQWFSCIYQRNWLQKYGNVRMLVWCNTDTALKLIAQPGSGKRGRCSLLSESFSNTSLAALTEKPARTKAELEILRHHDPVMIPQSCVAGVPSGLDSLALLDIKPTGDTRLVDEEDLMESWEYVIRQLMIVKNAPLAEGIKTLGAGADTYFEKELSPDIWNTQISHLHSSDFFEITQAFKYWPFKPDLRLFEMIV